jgi:hypothetical protein
MSSHDRRFELFDISYHRGTQTGKAVELANSAKVKYLSDDSEDEIGKQRIKKEKDRTYKEE